MRRVIIATNPNGRSNGQAFVDFSSSQDAEHAMGLDRQMFGNRYLEVRPPAHVLVCWLCGRWPCALCNRLLITHTKANLGGDLGRLIV